MIALTEAERADFDHIQQIDELPPHEYVIERGAVTGHAFADNGSSMVRDLTDARDVEADSNPEAEAVVYVATRPPRTRKSRED